MGEPNGLNYIPRDETIHAALQHMHASRCWEVAREHDGSYGTARKPWPDGAHLRREKRVTVTVTSVKPVRGKPVGGGLVGKVYPRSECAVLQMPLAKSITRPQRCCRCAAPWTTDDGQ